MFVVCQQPHGKKVLGSIPCWGETFLCGFCMFSLCLCVFFPGAVVSPTVKNMHVRSISRHYSWPRHWHRMWSWSRLPTAPQGWVKCRDTSQYVVYLTNKVPLPLTLNKIIFENTIEHLLENKERFGTHFRYSLLKEGKRRRHTPTSSKANHSLELPATIIMTGRIKQRYESECLLICKCYMITIRASFLSGANKSNI